MASNVAVFAVWFLSLLLGFNGSLRTPAIAARRGYSPKLGLLAGGVAGFAGTWIAALLIGTVFSDSAGVLGGLVGGLAGLAALWNLPRTGASRRPLSRRVRTCSETSRRAICAAG